MKKRFILLVSLVALLLMPKANAEVVLSPFNIELASKISTLSQMAWEMSAIDRTKYPVLEPAEAAKVINSSELVDKNTLSSFIESKSIIRETLINYQKNAMQIPLSFTTSYREQPALVINSVSLDSIYNTLRLNDHQRVARTMQIAIPYVVSLYKATTNLSYQYYIVGFAYGSQNFSEKYSSPRCEFFFFIAPKDELANYSNGLITDQDLINKCAILSSGRGETGVRRIAVSLQG